MKCLIIGKYINENVDQFREACIKIGCYLSMNNHSLQICSPFEDSADYWILKGFSLNSSDSMNAEIHFIDTLKLHQRIDVLSKNIGMQLIKIPHHQIGKFDDETNNYSWLFCQLQALDDCDFIVTIGGRKNGSAKMLLLIAESRGIPIIPFPFYNGIAEEIFHRNYFELKDRFGEAINLFEDNVEILDSGTVELFLDRSVIGVGNKRITQKDEMKFFISYSRERPHEADFIENILRRRNYNVYRDNTDFGAGSNIPNTIKEHIYSSDIFISVWCKEYACSPWCNDELEMALDRSIANHMELWLICVDDTRVVPKRARDILFYRVDSREKIEGRIMSLLDQL